MKENVLCCSKLLMVNLRISMSHGSSKSRMTYKLERCWKEAFTTLRADNNDGEAQNSR
jgi:hypothetical protein